MWLQTHSHTSNKPAKEHTLCLPFHRKNSCNLKFKGCALQSYLAMMSLGSKQRLGSILPASLPSQMMNLEPCRETTAAIRPVEEELHQNCSQSRQQDGLLQPMSGCGRQAHVALMSPAPQNPKGCGDKAVPLHCVWYYQHISAVSWLVISYLIIFSIMHFLLH